MIAKINKINNISELLISNRFRFALIGLIVMLAISYVFFANSAVRKVAALEKTKVQMQTILSELSDLESDNFSLSQNINNSEAARYGLVEVSPIFISKTPHKTSLSLK